MKLLLFENIKFVIVVYEDFDFLSKYIQTRDLRKTEVVGICDFASAELEARATNCLLREW
jgi:hypothetical protein